MAEAQSLIDYRSHLISDSGRGMFQRKLAKSMRGQYILPPRSSVVVCTSQCTCQLQRDKNTQRPVCVRLIQFSLPFTCCHRFSFLGKHDLEHLASCHNAHLWELCNSVTPKTVIPAGQLSACLKSWSAQPELWFFEGGNKVTFVYLFVLFLLLWYLPNPSFCELSAGYVKQDKLRQSMQSLRKTSSSLSLRKYTP